MQITIGVRSLAVAAAAAVGLVALGTAWATTPVGFSATNIVGPVVVEEFETKSHVGDHKTFLKTKGQSDVWITSITIAPGGHGGWHSHPGPSIITVKSGTATFYDDCDGADVPQVFAEGTGFVEDAECVHIVRNDGEVDLVIVVLQIVPRGAPRRIDEQAPL